MDNLERWLKVAAAFAMVFGGLIWLGAHPATAPVPTFFSDLLFWPLDRVQTGAADEARLLSAICGGVMVGWGLMLWTLAGEGMRVAPALTKRLILTSIWVWFVVDSAGSVLAGAPLNVLGNLVFLALFTLPFRFAGGRDTPA